MRLERLKCGGRTRADEKLVLTIRKGRSGSSSFFRARSGSDRLQAVVATQSIRRLSSVAEHNRKNPETIALSPQKSRGEGDRLMVSRRLHFNRSRYPLRLRRYQGFTKGERGRNAFWMKTKHGQPRLFTGPGSHSRRRRNHENETAVCGEHVPLYDDAARLGRRRPDSRRGGQEPQEGRRDHGRRPEALRERLQGSRPRPGSSFPRQRTQARRDVDARVASRLPRGDSRPPEDLHV